MTTTLPAAASPALVPPRASPFPAPRPLGAIRVVAWTAVVVLSVFQAYAQRYSMNPDGVSYLDLSDAVVRGHWSGLINLYWSPLYPALIGLARLITGAGPATEFQLVHGVNVVCFLAMFAAFEYFLFAVLEVAGRVRRSPLATTVGVAVTYAVVVAMAFTMTTVELATPDLLAAAATFLAMGALLRLHHAPALGTAARSERDAVILGLALGAGALAKSFLVPWSVVCLVVLALSLGRARLGITLRAVGIWLAFVVPLTAVMSHRAHRLTFGDAGRLTYAWYVDGDFTPSSGAMPAATQTRAVTSLVPGAGVAPNAQGTDPMWLDPARWNVPLAPHWEPSAQLGTIKVLIVFYVQNLTPLLFVLFLIAVAPPGTRRRAWNASWVVIVPAAAGVSAYALVVVTARYVMPFLVAGTLVVVATLPVARRVRPALLLLGVMLPIGIESIYTGTAGGLSVGASVVCAILAGAVVAPGPRARSRLAWGVWVLAAALAARVLLPPSLPAIVRVGAAVLSLLLWLVAVRAVRRGDPVAFAARTQAAFAVVIVGLIVARAELRWRDDMTVLRSAASPTYRNVNLQIARELAAHGVTPGTRIALIGPYADAYWARTARLQIVGDVPRPLAQVFWTRPPAVQDSLFDQFAAAGATVAVAELPPSGGAPDSTWIPIRFHAWIRPLARGSVR
jgi:hypothetical protein